MTFLRSFAAMLGCLAMACGPAGSVSETLNPTAFTVSTVQAPLALKAAPSFADERGGGVFVDVAGEVRRVRIDGSQSRLESHPGNLVSPGPASSAFPLGPFSAVVATTKGLFVAESGWLIAPPWRELLAPEGLVDTALDANGVGWLAHASGLFRLENGQLAELKSGGQSITGITAITVAPAADTGPAVWFAQGEQLSYAQRDTRDGFTIKDSGLSSDDIKGGVTALAGLAASPQSAGELWAITNDVLWRFADARWQRYDIGRAPREMVSAGRILWLRAGDALFRYDADSKSWGEAKGLSAVPALLAADASGAAWVRVGDETMAVTPGVPARVQGVFQNERVYGIEAPVVVLMPEGAQPTQVSFAVDEGEPKSVMKADAFPGEGPLATTLMFSMGGVDAAGKTKPASFAALSDGLHTVKVTASFEGAADTTRLLHFELKTGAAGAVSWAADIKPIHEARCAKCHTTGPGRDLSSYELWKVNHELIVNATKDLRMPADGLMDPTFIQRIARWSNGGQLP